MTFDRRAAVAAYKERKSIVGVYALSCLPTGEVWVGDAGDIDKIWNRLAFSLRGGAHPRRALQAAWTQHGEDAFRFEILERLEEEPNAYISDAARKTRRQHWLQARGAAPV